MKNLIVLLLFISINSLSVYSQTSGEYFTHTKSKGDFQVVYFEIIDLPDDFDEQTRVLEMLLLDENIIGGNVYFDDIRMTSTCQLVINPSVAVDYIAKIVRSSGYEMDKSDVSGNQKESERPITLHSSDKFSFFESFNGYKGYDLEQSQKISPEDYYQNQKADWISKNPKKYKEAKSRTVEKIIIDKKDLEVFSEEKRNRILSQPELYIIEE